MAARRRADTSDQLLPPRKPGLEISPTALSLDSTQSGEREKLPRQTVQELLTARRHAQPRWKRQTRWFRLWWAELTALILSFAFVAGNIVILSALDGQPYSTWRLANVNVTPNTLLSILATLSKSALLLPVAQGIAQLKWPYFQRKARRMYDLQVFDNASHGPVGSVSLLARLHVRALAACLGAIITIAALATEPFTQQIIVYRTQSLPAHNLTASMTAVSFVAENSTNVDLSLPGAMLSSLSGGTPDPLYNCPSSECTWPSFESLGLCTTCVDLTSSITPQCTDFEVPAFAAAAAISAPRVAYNASVCTYNLPPSVPPLPGVAPWTLFDHNLAAVSTDVNSSYMALTLANTSVVTYPVTQPTNATKGSFSNILATALTMFPNVTATTLDQAKNTRPQINKCDLSFCVKNYSISHFRGGALTNEVSSSTPLYFNGSLCTSVSVSAKSGEIYCPGYAGTSNATAAAFRPELSYNSTADLLASTPQDFYWISSQYLFQFQSTFKNLFQSYSYALELPAVEYLEMLGMRNPNATPNFTVPAPLTTFVKTTLNASAGQNVFSGEPMLQLVTANNGNVSATMSTVAIGMTNAVRQFSNATTIQGTAMLPIVIIHVGWPWVIYSVALPCLATVFLALVLWSSRAQDGLVWKNSTLPLVLQGIRSEDDHLTGAEEITHMEDLSKGMWMTVHRDELGRVRFAAYPATGEVMREGTVPIE